MLVSTNEGLTHDSRVLVGLASSGSVLGTTCPNIVSARLRGSEIQPNNQATHDPKSKNYARPLLLVKFSRFDIEIPDSETQVDCLNLGPW